jgi:hypothetical protein
MIADTLLLAFSLSLPPRAPVVRVPALHQLPTAPVAMARREESPESITTCYVNRSGSCWTEE